MSLKLEFDQVVNVPNNKWFNEIPGFEEIPTNTIIYKTKTGIGATFSEILSKRNSIIMLPHLSIIKNKQSKWGKKYNTFAVYGDGQETKYKDIVNYLLSDVKHKKFLTTPRGLDKIKFAINQISEKISNEDLYSQYFLLVDECHKWVKDTGYRDDMIPPIEDFFQFQKKAMVSATVIPLSDSRFKIQEFRHVRLNPVHALTKDIKWFREELISNPLRSVKGNQLKPVHPYKKDLKVFNVNGLTNGLIDYIKNNPVDTYCIFFNSIKGIKSLISDLKILEDSRIFCSSESCKLLKLEPIKYKCSDEFKKADAGLLTKYNFFTSSFYSGLDIDLCFKPNIIILTDACNAEYSKVDPYTDVLQIIGRFRNNMYKEIVHIYDYTKLTTTLSEERFQKQIDASKIFYEAVLNMKELLVDPEIEDFYSEYISRIFPHSTFLDQNGIYSSFKEDNYRDHNRVQTYYSEFYKLFAAYRNSGLYNLSFDREIYEKDQLIHLKQFPGKYSTKNNLMLSEALEELELIKGTNAYINYVQGLDQIFPIIVSAFRRLGFEKLKEIGFRKKAIMTQIILLDRDERKNFMPLIDLVLLNFQVGRSYSRDYIKKTMQSLYDSLGILDNAKGSDISAFFETKYRNMGTKHKSITGLLLIDIRYNLKNEYKRR
ncbi:hypothetical protein [Daejeonella oryzae]|uniref:hypothetical protein n=1 Tax=Daejeonella oryzae TaxID=1122943 RepID=UPI000410183B|nr:hypothetical protein [Daejeonella oryzae]